MLNILKWFFGIVFALILLYVTYLVIRAMFDYIYVEIIANDDKSTSTTTELSIFSGGIVSIFQNLKPFQYAPVDVVVERKYGHTNVGSLTNDSYIKSVIDGLANTDTDFDQRWGGSMYWSTKNNFQNSEKEASVRKVYVSNNTNIVVSNNFVLKGYAPIELYSNRIFPIFVLDSSRKIIGTVKAFANGDVRADSYVPFRAVITYSTTNSKNGYLVLGSETNIISVNFENKTTDLFINSYPKTLYFPSTNNQYIDGCAIGGCNMNLCVESREVRYIASLCEYRPHYACYQKAICERNRATGQCGWRVDNGLAACLENSY